MRLESSVKNAYTLHVLGGFEMNKYLMELVGTFFLVFTIGCTVVGNGAGPLAPLAIGADGDGVCRRAYLGSAFVKV